MTQTSPHTGRQATRPGTGQRLSLAEVFEALVDRPVPLRFTAYDGSATGPEDAEIGLELKNERGLAYLVTAPGDLGMARAYVSGDLDLHGVHPGDPYEAMVLLLRVLKFRRPSPAEALNLMRSIGLSHLVPPAPPRFSTMTRWPSCPSSCWAIGRAKASVPPPAAKGTISVIVRPGQVWAWTDAAARHGATRAIESGCLRLNRSS